MAASISSRMRALSASAIPAGIFFAGSKNGFSSGATSAIFEDWRATCSSKMRGGISLSAMPLVIRAIVCSKAVGSCRRRAM